MKTVRLTWTKLLLKHLREGHRLRPIENGLDRVDDTGGRIEQALDLLLEWVVAPRRHGAVERRLSAQQSAGADRRLPAQTQDHAGRHVPPTQVLAQPLAAKHGIALLANRKKTCCR